MIVTYVPEGLYWLFRCRDILKEEGCYSNAGCAVIFSSFENEISQWLQENKWKISYALGVVTPPEHDPVAHAWLEAENSNGKKYW
jgi:hypothetical protein